MKRFVLSLFAAFSTMLFVLGQNQAITMVSYEQSWLDSKGTLALRNNTTEEVQNIEFQIEYLDMSNNSLDYEDFFFEVEIAPGMTKKIDIPAYEHRRNYHYYKTKDDYGHPAFKIEYKLLGYNIEEETLTGSSGDLSELFDDDETVYILVAIALVIFVLGIWVGVYVLVAVMANRRNRSAALWLLLSFIATPLLAIIILLCVGKADKGDKYQ